MAYSETKMAYDLINSCEGFIESLRMYPKLISDIGFVTDRISYVKGYQDRGRYFPDDLVARINKLEKELQILQAEGIF
tara:strand:+ start:1052 stop:1285 length:234 start_codon:yes stop_codon:yes gene_type:complete